jgi:arylsulfatase A-like enzyme
MGKNVMPRLLLSAAMALKMRCRAALFLLFLLPLVQPAHAAPRRNIVIFVADGLRHSSVTVADTPLLAALRQRGVDFVNSHSLFPTFTTPNASAIATSHLLGDTGDFSNTLFVGYPNHVTGSVTPFIENDRVLGDLDAHFGAAGFLGETSLLAAARAAGWRTAAVGKVGPAYIQDLTAERDGTIVIDDSTGKPGGPKLDADITQRLTVAGLPLAAPGRGRNGAAGNNATAGATSANVEQQAWFVDAITRAILPAFKDADANFALVFWSRDPDGTQHNQGDSLNALTPGINGPTSRAGIANADANFRRILDWLRDNNELDRTDIFVTSDHGFSTISRHELANDAQHFAAGYATQQSYADVTPGWLPPGFVAIDLAHALDLPLFDPEAPIEGSADLAAGRIAYTRIDPAKGQHPRYGNALLGGTGRIEAGRTDAQVIVAANGGSDLIYLPADDALLARRVVAALLAQDTTSGVFVDAARFGAIPGALALEAIGLAGAALTPTPAIIVNFRSFDTRCGNPMACTVEIADTGLQEGQGMHGSFSRADTYNAMIALGPDFKAGFVDPAPVSNADIALTLAKAVGLALPDPGRGTLRGRVIAEALAGGPDAPVPDPVMLQSDPTAEGARTVVHAQKLNQGSTYLDAGGAVGRTVGLAP